jgi:hypothetical protein
MLTRGNHKLGDQFIWGFSLPSGRPDLCTGMSALCRRHCYARRLEQFRPALRASCERNWRLSRTPSFARRVRAFLVAHAVAVVRLHVGGDFYSARYARAWLRVMKRARTVRFYFYTRVWRDGAIRPVLERMARLPNCHAWYSCDRETGVPAVVAPRVRLAWLSVAADDLPPAQAALVFRIRRLRRQTAPHLAGVRVCPAEDGRRRPQPVTCERCQLCWQALPAPLTRRIPLPLLPPDRPTPSVETSSVPPKTRRDPSRPPQPPAGVEDA